MQYSETGPADDLSQSSAHHGRWMYNLARELFPMCRSISGDGVRQTLRVLHRLLPALMVHEVPSGTRCFDWTVPEEWNVRDAYVMDSTGRKVIDFAEHNLHLVGYSEPFEGLLSLEDLDAHLHSLPDMPEAIPYVTSYYKRRWGFCVRHSTRQALTPGQYYVKVDTTLAPGHLTYGELRIPGTSSREVLLSTYVCHPSMANNELSGPVVTAALAKWIQSQSRRLSYRILFIPETIGSIVYLSRHLSELKRRVVAGFVVTCVGDNRTYSFLPTRNGNTLADRVGRHVLKHTAPDYKSYSFAYDRGSDERQYCAPGVDLPMATVCRSLYARYPEYHTSDDNLDLISATGLEGGFSALQRCIEALENNGVPTTKVLCEPHLGPRGLYPTTGGQKEISREQWDILNLIAFADGTRTLLDIADHLDRPIWELSPVLARLITADVLSFSNTENA